MTSLGFAGTIGLNPWVVYDVLSLWHAVTVYQPICGNPMICHLCGWQPNGYTPDITPGGDRDRPKLGLPHLRLDGNRLASLEPGLAVGGQDQG